MRAAQGPAGRASLLTQGLAHIDPPPKKRIGRGRLGACCHPPIANALLQRRLNLGPGDPAILRRVPPDRIPGHMPTLRRVIHLKTRLDCDRSPHSGSMLKVVDRVSRAGCFSSTKHKTTFRTLYPSPARSSAIGRGSAEGSFAWLSGPTVPPGCLAH